jgi:hypothetical protein
MITISKPLPPYSDDDESRPDAKPGPLTFEFTRADALADTEGAFDFVEDLLSEGAASVVYGASNSGKTFFVLDLGAHVATGQDWQDREVEKGAVIYIALEGRQGARNRIEAMQMRGILPKGSPFYVCSSPVSLLDPAHPEAIRRLIASVEAEAALPVRLVIVDTMARAMAGGDENSGEDMGKAVKSIDAVKESTGAHVCVIHHCGKDAARGARGHSSLRAAIDTEIEITSTEGDKYRTASIVKQRDLAPRTPLCFSLDVVEVGINRRGKAITSCVVIAEDDMMASKGKAKPGPKAIYTCEMLLELLPQPSFKAWQATAKEAHSMGKDSFDGYRGKCADQWEKTRQGGIKKKLEPLPL